MRTKRTSKKKLYYHFTGDTLRDGRPIPPVGEWLIHEGKLVPCEKGLHASDHPFDALQYAPGPRLHLVELGGDRKTHGDPVDKICAQRRRIVKSIDATELLWGFARLCALEAVEECWKDAPQVVIDYLKSGKEELRAAARAAARDAARDAAWAAAWAAAEAAAWAAAEAAAWVAAGSAAWVAARDAAQRKQKKLFSDLVEEAFFKIK